MPIMNECVAPGSVLAEKQDDDFSDPLIGLQVERFRAYVRVFADRFESSSSEAVFETAEYLCEWSRNLQNRMFGRTTTREVERITQLFDAAANEIDRQLVLVTDHVLRERVEAFRDHIRNRTRLVLVR
jgi:hypothetical protein